MQFLIAIQHSEFGTAKQLLLYPAGELISYTELPDSIAGGSTRAKAGTVSINAFGPLIAGL